MDIDSRCGRLSLSVDVHSRSAAQATAAKFVTLTYYEFKLGWTSRELFLRWPVLSPQARDWRAVK